MKISNKEKSQEIITGILNTIASGEANLTDLVAYSGIFKCLWLLNLINTEQLNMLSEYIINKIEESEEI